jgi:hypothetical protein
MTVERSYLPKICSQEQASLRKSLIFRGFAVVLKELHPILFGVLLNHVKSSFWKEAQILTGRENATPGKCEGRFYMEALSKL